MFDVASMAAQVLPVALSFGALLVLARAHSANTRRPVKQPVPIPVERDIRE